MPGERSKEQRSRLKESNGKAITVYLTEEAAGAVNSIIELLSAKDDRLSMRDAICLAVVAAGDALTGAKARSRGHLRPMTGDAERNTTWNEEHQEYRAAWAKLQKNWRARLIQVRAHYEKVKRGRRPAGWTPPPPKLTHEEEQMQFFNALKEVDEDLSKR